MDGVKHVLIMHTYIHVQYSSLN